MNWNGSATWRGLVIGLGWLLAGGYAGSSGDLPAGSAEVRVTIPGHTAGRSKPTFPSEVDRVVVTISAPDMDTTTAEVSLAGGTASLTVPAGDHRRVAAQALAGTVVRMAGETVISRLKSGQKIDVTLTLVD